MTILKLNPFLWYNLTHFNGPKLGPCLQPVQKTDCGSSKISAWSQNVGMVTYSELDEINDVLRKSGNTTIRYPKQVITAIRNRRSIPPEADHLLVTSKTFIMSHYL